MTCFIERRHSSFTLFLERNVGESTFRHAYPHQQRGFDPIVKHVEVGEAALDRRGRGHRFVNAWKPVSYRAVAKGIPDSATVILDPSTELRMIEFERLSFSLSPCLSGFGVQCCEVALRVFEE